MHFYYLDESGDTGRDLANPDQPIMVLGGVSLRDEGWIRTHRRIDQIVRDFLGDAPPADFELHATDLLSPNGGGVFEGRSMEDRTQLAENLIDLLGERRHAVHYIAFHKQKIASTRCGVALAFNPSRPYLLGFDYMMTYVDWHVSNRLGRSARGMLIIDKKEQHHGDIERIVRNRRREGPVAHRLTSIVEITYAVDSKKNPMIQLSDLVIYCVRRFLEMDHGYRDGWNDETRSFYARMYRKISERMPRQELVERGGRGVRRLNEYIREVRCSPRRQWRREYQLA